MATRTLVEEAIVAINDNGTNTAFEVRDVLTKLLDYTENEENEENDFNLFDFSNEQPIENRRVAKFWYSFRGILNVTVNFTLKLEILESGVNNPEFEIETELYKVLNEIIQTNDLSFVVPVFRKGERLPITMIMMMSFDKENHIKFLLLSDSVEANDTITTSIQLHTSSKFGS